MVNPRPAQRCEKEKRVDDLKGDFTGEINLSTKMLSKPKRKPSPVAVSLGIAASSRLERGAPWEIINPSGDLWDVTHIFLLSQVLRLHFSE